MSRNYVIVLRSNQLTTCTKFYEWPIYQPIDRYQRLIHTAYNPKLLITYDVRPRQSEQTNKVRFKRLLKRNRLHTKRRTKFNADSLTVITNRLLKRSVVLVTNVVYLNHSHRNKHKIDNSNLMSLYTSKFSLYFSK
jgi:hypothetical protein